MKKPVNSVQKFEYIEALCQSIEDFTTEAEANNPDVFKYRGANLKYAFERSLYFMGAKNFTLLDFFSLWRYGQLPETFTFDSHLERDLAHYLSKQVLDINCLQVNPGKFISQAPQNFVRQFLFKSNLVFIPHKWDASILIYIEHPKFIRYTAQIVEQLPTPYAYFSKQKGNCKLFTKNDKLCVNTPRIPTLKFHYTRNFPGLSNLENLVRSYDYVDSLVKKINPKCLIVIEGNHPIDEIINQVGQQLGIPVICLQQGWAPMIHNGFRNMSYTKMLVWGEGFANLLKPYNPNQTFVVTGSHIINSTNTNSEQQISTLNQELPRKGIGFYLQAVSSLITRKEWDKFIGLLVWAAQEFPKVPMLVREHPQNPLSSQKKDELLRFPNVRLVPPNEFSLAQVFAVSCLTVAIYSTTILESIAAGIIPLIFNVTSLPTYLPDVQAAGAGIEVKNLEAAKQAIYRILTDEAFCRKFEFAMKKFQSHYFYQGNCQPTDRIVEEITTLLD